jgi:hypothetical protein
MGLDRGVAQLGVSQKHGNLPTFDFRTSQSRVLRRPSML